MKNKLKVILTVGLPASGKTTWAKEQIEKSNGNIKRISKDDLRAMLDNNKWSKANESFIIKIRDALIIEALKEGKSVIVDDTNLAEKHFNHIQQLVGQYDFRKLPEEAEDKGIGVDVETKDFTEIDVEECIKRDQKRLNYVGEKVIRMMYNQFLAPKSIEIKQDLNLPYAVLCDIDGTLALYDSKEHYDRDFINDKVNEPVAKILADYYYAHKELVTEYAIILVSGRKGKYKEETEKWLKKHQVNYDYLYMPRADDDNRKDIMIKQEIYEQHIKGKYNVNYVIDDRKQVKRFWVSQGLFVLDVNQQDLEF